MQTLTETQKELKEKISSLEKENASLKKTQNEFSEKIINSIQDVNLKDEANNVIKQVLTDIKEETLKLKQKMKMITWNYNWKISNQILIQLIHV